MAWNEPGGKDRDPWGNRKNDGLPDLDEMFRKFRNKLGGKSGGRSVGSGGSSNLWLMPILALIVVIWFLYGFYIVKEEERAVVLRFGKFLDIRLPGLTWIPSGFYSLEKVNISTYRSTSDITAAMLTEDENIVDIAYSVQYNVSNPQHYLFNVRDPDATLIQASESVIRGVVGANSMDYIITSDRAEIPLKAKIILQEILNNYQSGLNVITVNLNKAKEPAAVKHAFDDATKAREDKMKFIREAEAYRNGILPEARGEAQNLIEQSKGYKVRVTNYAAGEAVRFEKLLAEYRKAPEITRKRLYIDGVESVLSGNPKVFLDSNNDKNMLYLPIDRLMQRGGKPSVTIEPLKQLEQETSQMPIAGETTNSRSNLRQRDSK